MHMQELVCGLAMLDPAQAGDSAAITRFTFELIDIDGSQEIEPMGAHVLQNIRGN